MFRNLLAGAAVLVLTASVAAQSQVPVYKATNAKFAGVYTMDGGLDRSAAATRSGPTVIFNNTIASGYYSVPGAGQEWIDEGGLYDRVPTWLEDQINGFEFIYCSTEPDPTQNSGTITITYYDEQIRCAGPSAWPTYNCGYAIVGLPLGGPLGNIQCWIVTVDLEGGFECPPDLSGTFVTSGVPDSNGQVPRTFGWGFIPTQNNTGPWIRRGGYLRDNSFTWHDPVTGAFVGCFWFGGFPFASFSMKMFGNDPGIRAYDSTLAAGSNSLELQVKAGTPGTAWGAGASFTATVVNPTAGRTPWLVASSGSGDIGLPAGRALVNPGGVLPPTPLPMSGGVRSFVVPGNVPASVYMQAMETLNNNSPSQTNLPDGLSNGVRAVR